MNYYFPIKLPPNSQESLRKVNIVPQISGEPIKFDVNRTKAFQGTQSEQGQAILVAATQSKDGVISVLFNPSIASNRTFTVRLKAERNPSSDGTYQFTVCAFPSGENSVGLALGVGRFSIFSAH